MLPYIQLQFLLAADYVSYSSDDDPVFAAMMMALQAEPLTGFDFDSLNFKARSFFQYFVSTPGPFVGFAHCAIYSGVLLVP